ncbi:MAG: hypothetical protein WD489_05885 [Rhodovibrionaceae bacterium]
MRVHRLLQGFVLGCLLGAAPAAADEYGTTSELIENNAVIRVTLSGPPEARVSDFLLIHPDGSQVAASELERKTLVRETGRGGGGGVSTGVGVGVGSGGRVGTGVGIGINLGTLFSGDDDERVASEETTTVGRIAIPQPIHYLQLWQDYRLEVHYADDSGAHVLTIPTPRPRSADKQ